MVRYPMLLLVLFLLLGRSTFDSWDEEKENTIQSLIGPSLLLYFPDKRRDEKRRDETRREEAPPEAYASGQAWKERGRG